MSEIIENVRLNVTSPKTALPGLDEANRKLLALQGTIDQINARLSGLGQGFSRRSAAVISDTIKQLETKVGRGQTQKKISEVLGHDPKQVREYYVREQERMTRALEDSERKRKQLRGKANADARNDLLAKEKLMRDELTAMRRTFTGPQLRVTSPAAAGKFFHGFQQELFSDKRKYENFLAQMLGGKPANAPAAAAALTPAQMAALQQQALGGGRGAAAGGSTAAAQTQSPAAQAAAAHRKGLQEFRQKMAAAEREMAEAIRGDQKGGIANLNKFQTAGQKQRLANQIEGLVSGLTPKQQETVTAQNALKRSATLVTQAEKERAAGQAEIGKLRQQLAKAEAASDQAKQARLKKEIRDLNAHQRAAEKFVKGEQRRQARQAAGEATETWIGRGGSSQAAIDAAAAAAEKDHAEGEAARKRAARKAAQKPRATQEGRGGAEHETWLARGMTGFTPAGFAKNLLSIGAWSAAVAALYQPIRLISYSLTQMQEIGLQTARLSQTFRNVGGSAEDLRDDVLQSASAMGQFTADAMQASVAWSRLGLSRRQDAEATRVSLMAANVAEMTSAESTEHLAAVTAVYKLRVSELEGVLGMFNQTSNTARVRNRDLLEGISSVAAVGKEAGFSLAELQGIIGGSVEISGQSGNRMGNALKNILTRMGRPDVQDYLRNAAGVESRTPEGGEKSRAEVLRETFIAYQKLNESERTNLAGRVAGAHQANRFAAIMDSYLRSQYLAVEAQLHLNSAQQENAKVIATLKNQLGSLRAEWDRFVVKTDITGELSEMARAAKNVMRYVNTLDFGGTNQKRDLSKMSDAELGSAQPRKFLTFAADRDFADERARRWFAKRQSKGQSTRFLPWYAQADDRDLIDSYLKMAQETPFERGEGGFQNRVQQMTQRGEALHGKARLFDTVSQVFKTGLPGNLPAAAKAIAPWMGAGFSDASREQQQALVEAERQKALAAAADAEGEALQERTTRLRDARREEVRLAQAAAQARAESGADDPAKVAALAEHREAIKDLEEKTVSAATRYAAIEAEIAGQDEHTREVRQDSLNLLHQQADVLESMAAFYAQMNAPTAVRGLELRGQMLAEQMAAQEAFVKRLDDKRQPVILDEDQIKAEREKLRSLRAEHAAATDPITRSYVERQDLLTRGARQGRREMQPFSYGEDETDKLLRERAELERRVKEMKSAGLTLGGRGQLIEHENRLYEVQQQLLDRRYDVERDINQLLVDRRKEFARSFMDAGPTELLRKLAAFRLAFDNKGQSRPMSFGSFFAMSPGMRQDYSQFNPEFDPRLMELRREQNRNQRSPDASRSNVRAPFSTAPRAATATATEPAPAGTQAVQAAIQTMNMNLTANTVNIQANAGVVNIAALGQSGNAPAPFNPQSGGVGAGQGRTR